ncbi:MAG: hypothetical protein IPG34_02395 [Rhodocyclaceae bacterium]|nr:hypothetical protein [Rhodocyclaceae bacterium]
MKALVWITAAVLALFWSGLAFTTIAMFDWLAGAMPGGQLSEAAGAMAQWPVPAWLSLWVDPAFIQVAQSMVVELATWAKAALPEMPNLLAWVSPIIWIVWAIGMLMLLICAGIGHWLSGRWSTGAVGSKPV